MEEISNETQMNSYSLLKQRIALGTVGALGGAAMLAPYASAEINFSSIQELLAAVVNLIPSFMDLVLAVAPLIVTIAIVAFCLKFFDAILGMLQFK